MEVALIRILAAAAALGATLHATPAAAQGCPVPGGARPRLAAADASARLSFVRGELDAQAAFAHEWTTAWLSINTVVTAGAFGLAAIASDETDRDDNLIAGGFATANAFAGLLFRLRVESDAPRLDALARTLGDGAAMRCLLLARGEQLFARDAADQRASAGWFAHALAVVGNGALFVILGPVLGHWADAVLDTVGGLLLNEAQIFTQPTGLVSAWQRYRRGDLSRPGATRSSLRLGPAPARGALGLGLYASF